MTATAPRHRPASLMLFAASCLLACTSTPETAPGHVGRIGHTEVSASLSTVGNRLALESNESFLMPLDDPANAAPHYPADLLSKGWPPRVVCLHVDIAEDGTVVAATPTEDGSTCPAAPAPAFVEAARTAVLTWRFEPALRCVFPDASTRGRSLYSCAGGDEHPQAIRLTYRFVFESIDGRGVVRMGR